MFDKLNYFVQLGHKRTGIANSYSERVLEKYTNVRQSEVRTLKKDKGIAKYCTCHHDRHEYLTLSLVVYYCHSFFELPTKQF